MNIFEVLSSGNSDLNEENVTAFLAWLLDPWQTHGLGTAFLDRFLKAVLDEKDHEAYQGVAHLAKGATSLRTSVDRKISVLMERSVEPGNGRRSIDIDVEISLGSDKPRHIIIENKIRDSAIEEDQLLDELNGFLKDSTLVTAIEDIVFVFITNSDSQEAQKAFAKLPKDVKKRHLIWRKDSPASIPVIIKEILVADREAEIDPIAQETIGTLKAFLRFIQNDFRKSRVSTTGDYFAGQVQGLDDLKSLVASSPKAYIGFYGGIKALEKSTLQALRERTYKWDTDPERGNKQKKNWLQIGTVLDIVASKEREE